MGADCGCFTGLTRWVQHGPRGRSLSDCGGVAASSLEAWSKPISPGPSPLLIAALNPTLLTNAPGTSCRDTADVANRSLQDCCSERSNKGVGVAFASQADLSNCNARGRNAAFHAASRPDNTVLVQDGAPTLDPRTQMGDAPLFASVRDGNISTMQRLLDLRADVNARNKDGVSALDLAHSLSNQQFAELLTAHGATATSAMNEIMVPVY